jgi:hypothetical protein
VAVSWLLLNTLVKCAVGWRNKSHKGEENDDTTS